jgi:hypothetical protein
MLLLTGCNTTRKTEDHNQHWMFCVGACLSLKDDKDSAILITEKVKLPEDEDGSDGLFR